MSTPSQPADQGGRAKCPYCGCGFFPTEPGQVYCSPFCEQQDALEKRPRGQSG
jgi:uncharacterized Zn finger protein (UPF0148 family)